MVSAFQDAGVDRRGSPRSQRLKDGRGSQETGAELGEGGAGGGRSFHKSRSRSAAWTPEWKAGPPPGPESCETWANGPSAHY